MVRRAYTQKRRGGYQKASVRVYARPRIWDLRRTKICIRRDRLDCYLHWRPESFIEAKVLYESGSSGKKHIINGFKQAYLYFEDHLAPVGYLIIFKTRDVDLKLNFSDKGDDSRFVDYNQIRIYLE